MPSKGIKLTTYNTIPDLTTTFSVPGETLTKSRPLGAHAQDRLEVESSRLPRFKFSGDFEVHVAGLRGREDHALLQRSVGVNTLTGKLEVGGIGCGTVFVDGQAGGGKGEGDGVVVTYTFYDAGPGLAHLPKQHHCAVTTTVDKAAWMARVVPSASPLADTPFRKMVLPAPHDAGMNSLDTATFLLERAGSGVIREVLGRSLPHGFEALNRISDRGVARFAPGIVRALAVTQVCSVRSMLRIGARYFEFRPARCHERLLGWRDGWSGGGGKGSDGFEDTLYFQHGAIPGIAYRLFLEDVVSFLAEHEGEIVVVQNRWDGVPGECARPSDEELQSVLDSVLRGKENVVRAGGRDDMMGKSVRQLRDEKKRLLVFRNARQVSNYDDDANATLDGESMVEKLKTMAKDPPQGDHDVFLVQCQATPTNIRDVVIASVVDCDDLTSPLLATKPVCDAKMLPLLRGECGKKLMGGEGLVVVGNDFFDGATADVAIQMCRERMEC